jgi:putative peptidoglycan lipid II flippase
VFTSIARFRAWREGSVGRRIFHALLTVSGVTALIKLLGAAKIIVIARYFGVGDELDAYLIAFLIPSFFADMVAGAASPALIPAFIRARDGEGHHSADKLLGSVLFAGSAACLLLIALIVTFAEPFLYLVASGFSEGKIRLTRSLLLILAPIIVLGGLSSVWRAVLNAQNRFAFPAATFGLTPLVTIAAIVLWGSDRDAHSLAFGTLAGAGLECISVGWYIHACGFSPLPRWRGWGADVKCVARQYWPLLAASLFFGASSYVNQSIAAALGSGSVSALNYGSRLLNVLQALGPAALGTAVLPHFSQMATRSEWSALRNTFRDYNRTVWWIGLPVTLALIGLSEPVVRLLFQRGEFSAADTQAVVNVQRFYLLQLPFAVPAVMAARLLSSLQSNRSLLDAAAAYLLINASIAIVLSSQLGVSGIALGNSIAMGIYYCYLARVLSLRQGGAGAPSG